MDEVEVVCFVMDTAATETYTILFVGSVRMCIRDSPYIGQDVYYYESDWFEKLPDAVYDGLTIYVEEYAMGEGPFTYAFEELYEELYETKQTEIINELKDEGYEH